MDVHLLINEFIERLWRKFIRGKSKREGSRIDDGNEMKRCWFYSIKYLLLAEGIGEEC